MELVEGTDGGGPRALGNWKAGDTPANVCNIAKEGKEFFGFNSLVD
jgi:hypothetical protein